MSSPMIRALPTLQDVMAARAGRPIPKGPTRLQVHEQQAPLTKVDEKTFRADVWRRDKDRCRCCGRKVVKTLSRVPERGEVHHLHGRVGDLRFEVRAAILACLTCHEKLTGKVNEHRLVAIPSKTFTIRQGAFTDARHPVTFKRLT